MQADAILGSGSVREAISAGCAAGGNRVAGGDEGDGSAIPLATERGIHFFELGVDQSTLMRVPAVDPVTSAMGVPTPTAAKLGGQSLKSKEPL